jgi:hypothetical protein
MARASFPITAPIAENRVALKVAPVVMTCGNEVANGVELPKFTPGDPATPATYTHIHTQQAVNKLEAMHCTAASKQA